MRMLFHSIEDLWHPMLFMQKQVPDGISRLELESRKVVLYALVRYKSSVALSTRSGHCDE